MKIADITICYFYIVGFITNYTGSEVTLDTTYTWEGKTIIVTVVAFKDTRSCTFSQNMIIVTGDPPSVKVK